MHAYFPIIVVLLAIITAVSIAYIAWELTSDKNHGQETTKPESDTHQSDK